MNPLASTRLYLSNRSMTIWVPVFILIATVAFMTLVGLIIGIQMGLPLPVDVQEGFATNMAVVWTVAGFLVSTGAIAVNRNFAMALAFGSTRRNFWLGSALGFVLTSLVVGVGSVALLIVERATGNWFIGVRTFDVGFLGSGDLAICFLATFALSLLWLFIGALFGTVYRAFGARWVVILAGAVAVLVLGGVAGTVASWSTVAQILTTAGAWITVLLASGIAILAAAGSYAANRLATI